MASTINKFFKREVDLWSTSTLLVALLIITPLAIVVLGLGHAGPKWTHISDTVLFTYIGNTVGLAAAVSALALLMAVPQAWLVSAFEFPGRRLFEWTLVLPLAVPTYVAAFAYYHFPEQAIPLLIQIRDTFGVATYAFAEKTIRYGLLSLFLAGVLFPYIYISARASFSQQRRAVIEAAQTLGRSPAATFFSVALPLARPAIVAGLSLVLMEVINDYGAVHLFGVPTLTEGIFRTWFGLGDRASAIRLAGIIMVALLAFLALEHAHRGRARFAEPSVSPAPLSRRKLSRGAAAAAIITCLIPLTIGLLFPLWRLITWSTMTWHKVFTPDFQQHITHSVLLALVTTLVLTAIAILFAYTERLHHSRFLNGLGRVATLGYAAPGAVVAIGVMVAFGASDSFFASLSTKLGLPKFLISGSLLAIAFAYIVRFLAVPVQPLRAGMARVCGSLDDASRILGKSPGTTLRKINLPILRGTIIAAAMLVFVDILKELPLTIILRPANFETLATTAFGLATEGRIQESAVPSLIIVLTGGVGLIILNRFMRRNSP
ncbi:MAG: iron ABC transporter permease [Verrucomicrobiota bacterium]